MRQSSAGPGKVHRMDKISQVVEDVAILHQFNNPFQIMCRRIDVKKGFRSE